MLRNCIAVGLGGFAGSILRYLVGLALPSSEFPLSTLAINVVGSFVLALLTVLVAEGALADEQVSLMLTTGLCGGFTTFSTFSVQTMQLGQQGHIGMALSYAVLSVSLGVLAAVAGGWVAKAV